MPYWTFVIGQKRTFPFFLEGCEIARYRRVDTLSYDPSGETIHVSPLAADWISVRFGVRQHFFR